MSYLPPVTDKGARGWGMSYLPPGKVQHLVGRRVGDLYDMAKGPVEDAYGIQIPLHDLVGFTRWRHRMPELEKAGILTSPHTWAWIPRPHYVAQLAGGLGNVCIIEGIPGTTRGVAYSAYTFDGEGNLVLPDKPGFGLTLKD